METGNAVILIANPSDTTADEVSRLQEQLLSEDERDAVRRFVVPRDQHDHTISRALVRLGLSSFFSVTPRDWRFVREPHHKPFIGSPERFASVQFSVSHTRGAIALLVTSESQAGVDVEKIEATRDLPAVAEGVFYGEELNQLNQTSGAAWDERFFTLWTLKEAYVKARGLGLSLPLKSISFSFAPTGEPVVSFGNEINDGARDWFFWRRQISPAHILAAAIRNPGGRKIELTLRHVRVRASAEKCWIEPAAASL